MSEHALQQAENFRAGRAMGLDHRKLGMWLFIASEVMFFGGLIAAYLHYKYTLGFPESGELDVVLVGINTMVLLTSSFTVVSALSAIRQGRQGRFVLFLLLTILLGIAFLTGQVFEFAALYRHGITLTSGVFGSAFFTLTGFHGLHVVAGVLWATVVLVRGLRHSFDRDRTMGVEIFGLYWHFVDIVWIVLFTQIYLVV
ncbi:MAG TPA: cytochrome c oxidase subunit 3 [Anaerolineales bacterium]|nr:cytochrome c oxidase subunit 3 [Anaerolineales bacterium]